MPAAVPLKCAVCATLCKPAVQGTDIIPHRSQRCISCALFPVAKAQVNALCLYWVLLFKFHPFRKPNRGRGGGDTVEQLCLGGGPQSKQPCQRVATQNDFDVLREMKLLLQRGNDLFCQKAQGVPSISTETLLSLNSRSFPRGKCIVPVFHWNGCKQKVVRTLCNSGNLAFHALQLVFAGHLEQ